MWAINVKNPSKRVDVRMSQVITQYFYWCLSTLSVALCLDLRHRLTQRQRVALQKRVSHPLLWELAGFASCLVLDLLHAGHVLLHRILVPLRRVQVHDCS